jgi:T-complex protein 1 subunit epsilon
LAVATGAKIVPRFEELHYNKLGFAGLIEEVNMSTNSSNNMIIIRELSLIKTVTVVIKGGSTTITEEVQRSLNDAMCVVRNIIKSPQIIIGGGATELSLGLSLRNMAEDLCSVE